MDPFEPDRPTEEEEERLQAEREAERQDRSDAEWWQQDHLEGPSAASLSEALGTLRDGCGCDVGRLLSTLREIERLSDGYSFFLGRRELPTIIKRLRDLAGDLERVELSQLQYSLPKNRLRPEELSAHADTLEKAQKATTRTAVPEQDTRIRQFIAYVDDRVSQYAAIGKRAADAAMAVLLSAVTHDKWTRDALRMHRSRANKKRGRTRVPRDRPRIRTRLKVRGSRAKKRKSRFVRFDEHLAAEERLAARSAGEDDDGGVANGDAEGGGDEIVDLDTWTGRPR